MKVKRTNIIYETGMNSPFDTNMFFSNAMNKKGNVIYEHFLFTIIKNRIPKCD